MPTFNIPQDFNNLQAALDSALPGDVVITDSSDLTNESYYVFTDQLTVDGNLAPGDLFRVDTFILGSDVAEFTLTGDGITRVVDNPGNTTLAFGDGRTFVEQAAGQNTIDFGGGDDQFHGTTRSMSLIDMGDGDDRYTAVGGHDTVQGGAGSDTLDFVRAQSGVSISLVDAGPQALGSGTLVASGFENIRDSRFDDVFIGSGQDNSFELSGGSDTVIALGGDDTLSAQIASGDRVTFLAGAGDDLIRAEGDGDLRVLGGAGNDTISSFADADTLIGGAGRDIIEFGAGRDVIFGADVDGLGDGERDVFVWQSLETGSDRSVIRDFEQGTDLISLDLQAPRGGTVGNQGHYDFIGSAAFSGTAAEVRASTVGAWTLVQIDQDGDGTADGELLLDGSITPTADDFLL